MAVLINEPKAEAGTQDWILSLYRTTVLNGGYELIDFSEKNTDNAPVIKNGSRFEINGSFYTCPEDETPESTGLTTGVIYLYVRAVNEAAAFFWSSQAPVYNANHGGWYNGNNRALLISFYLNGSYLHKRKLNHHNNSDAEIGFDKFIIIPGNNRIAGMPSTVTQSGVYELEKGFHSFVVSGAGGSGGGGAGNAGTDNKVTGGNGGAGGYVEETVYFPRKTKVYILFGTGGGTTGYGAGPSRHSGTGGGGGGSASLIIIPEFDYVLAAGGGGGGGGGILGDLNNQIGGGGGGGAGGSYGSGGKGGNGGKSGTSVAEPENPEIGGAGGVYSIELALLPGNYSAIPGQGMKGGSTNKNAGENGSPALIVEYLKFDNDIIEIDHGVIGGAGGDAGAGVGSSSNSNVIGGNGSPGGNNRNAVLGLGAAGGTGGTTSSGTTGAGQAGDPGDVKVI